MSDYLHSNGFYYSTDEVINFANQAEMDFDDFVKDRGLKSTINFGEINSEVPKTSADDFEGSIFRQERETMNKLSKMYGGLGFTFDQEGYGTDKVVVKSPPDENGNIEQKEFYLGFLGMGGDAEQTSQEINEFVKQNLEKSSVNTDVYSKTWKIANTSEIIVDGKNKSLEELSSEELEDHIVKVYRTAISEGLPGSKKIFKEINDQLEPFAQSKIKELQTKYDLSNNDQYNLALEEYNAAISDKHEELLNSSQEFEKINESVLAAIESRFGKAKSDKLREEAEDKYLPSWLTNMFDGDNDYARQAYITGLIKLPKAKAEERIMSNSIDYQNAIKEYNWLKSEDPDGTYNANASATAGNEWAVKNQVSRRMTNKERMDFLGTQLADINQNIADNMAKQQKYQEKLNNLRVPTVFGKDISDPDLTLDEWQGMLGDQTVQMLAAVVTGGYSTYVQEGGGAAMDIIKIHAARNAFPGLEDGQALKKFYSLPAEDKEGKKGQQYYMSQVIDNGEANLAPAIRTGYMNAGYDMASNFFVIGKAAKFIPKSLARDLWNLQIKKFIKGGWQQVGKDVASASFVEFLTETAQEGTSIVNVGLSTGYYGNKDDNLKRLGEAGAQALLSTGPITIGGKTATSVYQEGKARYRAMVDPNDVRNVINSMKKDIDADFKKGNITKEKRNELFTELEAEESVINSFKEYGEMNYDQKERVVKARIEKSKLNKRKKELEEQNKNILEASEDVDVVKLKNEEEIKRIDEQIKKEENKVLSEVAIVLYEKGKKLAEHVNNDDTDSYNNAKVKYFDTYEQAKEYAKEENLDFTRLIDKKVNGLEIDGVTYIVDEGKHDEIRNNSLAANSALIANTVHHEILHSLTGSLDLKNLEEIYNGIVNELTSTKDPVLQKIGLAAASLFATRYSRLKERNEEYYLEYLSNLSDAFKLYNLTNLTPESGSSFDAISRVLSSVFHNKTKFGLDWKNFNSKNALDYIKQWSNYYGEAKKGPRYQIKGKTDAQPKKKVKKVALASEKLLYTDINDTFNEFLSVDKNIAAEMTADMMQGIVYNKLLDLKNADVIKGFSNPDLEQITLQFTGPIANLPSSIKNRGAVGLLNKYDPNFEGGVMGYFNATIRGRKMLDMRLQEFVENHPKYGNIEVSFEQEGVMQAVDKQEEALSPEEIMIQKEEKKKPKKQKKQDVMLYDEFVKKGFPEAEAVHEYLVDEYSKLHKEGKLEGMALKDLKKIGMAKIQELFGVSPKPGNLTKDDVKASQRVVKKLGKDFWNKYVLFKHYTNGIPLRGADGKVVFDKNGNMVIDKDTKDLATGLPQVLQTERPTKSNGLKEIQDVFYELDKRGKNLKLKLKKDFDDKYFFEKFGVLSDDPNLYKKSSNISQVHRGLHTATLQVMSSQAARTVLGKGRAFDLLQDGLSPTLYSEKIKDLDNDVYVELMAAMQDIGNKVRAFANDYDKKILKNILESSLNPETFYSKRITMLVNELDKVFARYVDQVKRFEKIGKRPKDIKVYIENEILFEEKILSDLLGTDLAKDWVDADVVQRSRDAVPIMVDEFINKYGEKKGVELALKYILPMITGAGKISDGSLEVVDGKVKKIDIKKWEEMEIMYKMLHEGKGMPTNRRKIFKDNEDAINNGLSLSAKGLLKIGLKPPAADGKRAVDLNNIYIGDKKIEGLQTKLLDQSSKSMVNKISKEGESSVKKQSKKEADEAMYFIHDVLNVYKNTAFLDNKALGLVMNGINSSMKSPMRRAANLLYVFDGYETVKNPGKDLEYEHMIPAQDMLIRHYEGVYDGTITDENVKEKYKDYTVQIIPVEMNSVLKQAGYNSLMPNDYELGKGSWRRNYNDRTLGKNNVVAIRELNTKKYIGLVAQKISKSFNKDHISINKFAKAKRKAGAYGFASEKIKGITILDFDDTLATSKSKVKFTRPDGTKGSLTPEQYASTYQDLQDLGYSFDFSEFNKVVKGKVAPLFQKALKLQGKFGPENMFVLTARPPESQKAIFDFLKANGLNIPLKNITGLANSTAEAKALWIADKVGEGYNDFYFADDALQNVQAVDNMLEQFDVKRKVQQAKVKFSEKLNEDFNDILETLTGIESKKRFDFIKARKRGASKGKFRYFIPPSHEDFVGLLYNFMGKGAEGNRHRDFLEQALIRPLNRANKEYDTARQSVATDYKNLNKQAPNVKKMLIKKTPDGDFTYQDAIRIYLWDKHGYDIPGLSPIDQKNLVELVNSDPDLKSYADAINIISKQEAYVSPTDGWDSGDIRMDLDDATGRIGRAQFFEEFIQNADIIFSKENLNKIEAGYGKGVREALEDMLYRIKTGRNKPTGQNGMVNRLMNWVNGSVGSVMFFNMRSALLQQMSLVNYINFADNNIFAAAKAFANQKQYWKDWAYIFNSDMLKQRRGGIQTDVNGAELAAEMRKSKNPHRFLISKLLELGFLPTQIGDNIAIATGGATYYRNRINAYLKQGLSQKEAEQKAWTDFQDITQSTQQSARPDMVSKQQASLIGKIILNFQNVTSQFNRLGKKAFLDIKNRRITKPNTTQMQSDISNAARITYYFAVQNAIFYTLQTALFMMMFDDDEEDPNNLFLKKRERLINGSIDSVLRGSGITGAVISTLKNVAIAFARQRDVNYNPDESAVLVEALNFSPVIGIKARKIANAEKTLNYNKKVMNIMSDFDIDNPQWSAVTNYIEGFTNLPLNRLYNKTQNVRQGFNNEHAAWERALMFLGWSQYNLDLENKKMDKIKEQSKKKKQTFKSGSATKPNFQKPKFKK